MTAQVVPYAKLARNQRKPGGFRYTYPATVYVLPMMRFGWSPILERHIATLDHHIEALASPAPDRKPAVLDRAN
jgi:hypothetical protein